MSTFNETPQVPLLVVMEEEKAAQASHTPQVPLLVVLEETIYAKVANTPQVPLLVVQEAAAPTRTSQAPLLVVFGSGGRENFNLRAWTFFLDGNWYYVLHLGMLGTLIYCVSTDTWAEWVTAGYENWNAEQGIVWDSRIVVGDNQNGILWEVDPNTMVDDDFRPITRVVTALLPQSGRETTTVDGMWITASVGFPTSDDPLVNLRFSDDAGNTWVDMDDCTVTLLPGQYSQEIAFRSLGTFGAPGRVFEVSDQGGAVRIDRASVETH